jgi:hypothetical protein
MQLSKYGFIVAARHPETKVDVLTQNFGKLLRSHSMHVRYSMA